MKSQASSAKTLRTAHSSCKKNPQEYVSCCHDHQQHHAGTFSIPSHCRNPNAFAFHILFLQELLFQFSFFFLLSLLIFFLSFLLFFFLHFNLKIAGSSSLNFLPLPKYEKIISSCCCQLYSPKFPCRRHKWHIRFEIWQYCTSFQEKKGNSQLQPFPNL